MISLSVTEKSKRGWYILLKFLTAAQRKQFEFEILRMFSLVKIPEKEHMKCLFLVSIEEGETGTCY